MGNTAKLDREGRLFLPLKVRRELGLDENSELVIHVENGGIRVHAREAALADLQASLRKLRRPGRSILDEFSKERRDEARRECEES